MHDVEKMNFDMVLWWVTIQDIASRLTKDVSEVKKIIRENKTLPSAATPPTPQEAVPVSPVRWPSAKIRGCAVTSYNTRSRQPQS